MAVRYSVEQIQPDDAGFELFLTKYKPFRLQALQNDPKFFGSNYAREVAMSDEDWRKRVTNPKAKRFVAIDSENGDIISSATILRGVRVSPLLAMAIGLTAEERDLDSPRLLHWEINAVYTAPRVRRQGISEAVISESIKVAKEVASEEGKSCLVSVLTLNDNANALKLYEKLGFSALMDINEDGELRLHLWIP